MRYNLKHNFAIFILSCITISCLTPALIDNFYQQYNLTRNKSQVVSDINAISQLEKASAQSLTYKSVMLYDKAHGTDLSIKLQAPSTFSAQIPTLHEQLNQLKQANDDTLTLINRKSTFLQLFGLLKIIGEWLALTCGAWAINNILDCMFKENF